MKNSCIYLTLVLIITLTHSCKKEEENHLPSAPSVITNKPDVQEYLAGVMKFSDGKSYAVWTTDGLNFKKFTTYFDNVKLARVVGNSLLIFNNQTIAVADLDHLTEFKTTTLSEHGSLVKEIAMIKDMVVLHLSGTKTIAYWDYVKNSPVDFYEFPSTQEVDNLTTVGSNLIMLMYDYSTGKRMMVFSQDGKNWSTKNHAMYNAGSYEYKNGKTWAFGYDRWAYTVDTDLNSANWIIDSADSFTFNTTDTVGNFLSAAGQIINRNEWRIYGSIRAYQTTENLYPCVSISTDEGTTWTTTFLKGLPHYTADTYMRPAIYSTSSITIFDVTDEWTFPNGIYSSTDQIEFKLWTNQIQVDQFRNFSYVHYVGG